jgi:hypothetical protein
MSRVPEDYIGDAPWYDVVEELPTSPVRFSEAVCTPMRTYHVFSESQFEASI